jgi:hypothetical protein
LLPSTAIIGCPPLNNNELLLTTEPEIYGWRHEGGSQNRPMTRRLLWIIEYAPK